MVYTSFFPDIILTITEHENSAIFSSSICKKIQHIPGKISSKGLETSHNRLYNFVCILYNVYKKVDYFMEEREKLKSRLGFILLSAGCAIGIGNVWKFPYTAGQGGGGAFVLFYLLFLIIL